MFTYLKKLFKAKEIHYLTKDDKKLLNKYIFYYNQLSKEKQTDFEKEIAIFFNQVPIYFQQTKTSRLVELMVASSAIIVTFGHPFSYKRHLTSVTIVKGAVSKTIQGFTSGEVRIQNSFKTMYLSEQALIQGFKNSNDKKHVGIHEFVHILDIADGYIDGIPSLFMPKRLVKIWHNLADEEMKYIQKNNSTIRAYGATNIQEFLTVCSEYFFERPKKLKKEHPKVYQILQNTFNQNPEEEYDFKQKDTFNKKKEIGRNDPCFCGSGIKYKKCCLK